MIDFSLPDELAELKDRIDTFIRDRVIPMEHDPRADAHGPSDELRLELVGMARAEGLLSPHAPVEWGGLGLDHIGMAVAFEAAGYSSLGALALNIQAPDEGNTNLLHKVATTAQKERWLKPLAAGEIRTAFAMTEPDNGAGSDPSLMKVTAEKRGDKFVINGRKWLITGYPGASLVIVMAKTLDTDGTDLGATMFLVPMDTPGMKLVEMHNTMDSNSPGGHAIIDFQDLEVPVEDVLGDVGQGFRNAQVRLAPARMTHCMRWLGQARRCHDIAAGHANYRKAFGKTIGQHQGIGFQLADSEIELNLCRLAIWHCCWLLDRGEQARSEVSQCKVFCSEALGWVVDRSLQVLGGMGIMDTTIIERTYRDIRAFRIYDGPSEVHRHVLARGIAKAAGQ